MNRWIVLAAALAAAALTAQAQVAPPAQPLGEGGVIRTAPADVKPARMVVTLPPQVTLDGKPDRLSPGARIRDTNNMMVLSGTLANRPVPVVYRRDSLGLVHEVWLLTEAEYGKLGGAADSDSADGHKRFAELLDLIFGSRR